MIFRVDTIAFWALSFCIEFLRFLSISSNPIPGLSVCQASSLDLALVGSLILLPLRSLADPPTKPEPLPLVSLGVVGAVALFFLMGVFAGLASVGYHLIGGR